jgi:hypothetical protein
MTNEIIAELSASVNVEFIAGLRYRCRPNSRSRKAGSRRNIRGETSIVAKIVLIGLKQTAEPASKCSPQVSSRMQMKIRIRFLKRWKHPYRGGPYEPGDTALLAPAAAEILCAKGIAEALVEFNAAQGILVDEPSVLARGGETIDLRGLLK